MRIWLFILFVASPVWAGNFRYGMPDYATMLREADLVAVVRFVDLRDSGNKKELNGVDSNPTGLHFRELKGKARVISLIKGDPGGDVTCRFYRYPSIEESTEDLGDPDLARRRLAACLRDFGLVHVFPGPPCETAGFEITDFLVYLKKSADGWYEPVTGDSDSDSSIRMLSRPGVSPKLSNEGEPNR